MTSRRGARWDGARYAIPGAAVLATGVLAAAGYMLKDRLADLAADALRGATQGAAKVARETSNLAGDAREQSRASIEALLHVAGLERRSRFTSIVAPALGVACGFLAGAVLTHFFAPRLLEHLGIGGAPVNDVDPVHDAHAEPSPDPGTGPEVIRSNGAFQRPVS